MIALEQFSHALDSVDPGQALRGFVLQLAAEGHAKAEIVESLERLLLWLKDLDTRSETGEDAVLDVLDALSGWCHPGAQLLPKE